MSVLHVNHIKAKLAEIYKDKIDISDAKSEQDKENFFLTRSFAAYTLQVLANIDPDVASSAIVDSYDDNGLDAIYYDRKNKYLWLVQSKWIKNGIGEPETGEVGKFKAGIIDLIELQLDRFNKKVQDKENEILEALEDPLVKLKIVLTFTGKDGLSEHNQRIIDDLLEELNDPTELAIFSRFSLKQSHKSLVGIMEGQPIKADLILSNWGKVEEPYFAIYGTINGSDIANIWAENRGKLFSENIRDFIGFSEVNEDIVETIQNEPENFYFYNNGITALCQSINKKPLGGSDRNSGIFVAEDFKIVNGAQTVGTLGNIFEKNPDKVGETKVFIKVISLEGCPKGFGLNVTKKTNTQNKVDKRDFVSLDPEQERIKIELALESINYHYKRSDSMPKNDNSNYNVEEVITSIACSLPNVDNSVLAKREVGKLWEDITQKPYTEIITPTLSAIQILRTVQINRETIRILKIKEKGSAGRNKSHYIHSNRFTLHIVLSKIGQHIIFDPHFNFSEYKKTELENFISLTIEEIKSTADKLYKTSLVHQIYRNYTKCREIKNNLIK